MKMPADDPRAGSLAAAIRAGDVEALQRLLTERGGLATARCVDPACGDEGTSLHPPCRLELRLVNDDREGTIGRVPG
jgi:hypothetical protein